MKLYNLIRQQQIKADFSGHGDIYKFFDEIQQWLKKLGLNPKNVGSSQTSIYFDIQGGQRIDINDDIQPKTWELRISDHKGTRQSEIDYDMRYEFIKNDDIEQEQLGKYKYILLPQYEIKYFKEWIDEKKDKMFDDNGDQIETI